MPNRERMWIFHWVWYCKQLVFVRTMQLSVNRAPFFYFSLLLELRSTCKRRTATEYGSKEEMKYFWYRSCHIHKKTKNINYKAYSKNKEHHHHRSDAVFFYKFNMQLEVHMYSLLSLLFCDTYYEAHACVGSLRTLLYYNTEKCT